MKCTFGAWRYIIISTTTEGSKTVNVVINSTYSGKSSTIKETITKVTRKADPKIDVDVTRNGVLITLTVFGKKIHYRMD
jgi:hypothetical protein